MNIYRALQAGLEPTKTDLPAIERTLGGAVMAVVKRNNWRAPDHLAQITSEFYRQLTLFGWRWTPSRSCGAQDKAAEILDGSMVQAECQVAANAFKMLLEAKAPYGFGLDRVGLKTYSGERTPIGAEKTSAPTAKDSRRAVNSNMGFYSTHPLEGVHGLAPNVFDVDTGKLAAVYSWKDHKVVEYGGRFYDVCYDKVYVNPIEMAMALVLGCNEDSRPTKTIQEAMSRVCEYKVMVLAYFQIAYFRSAPPNSAADRVGASEEGPYDASLFGDEATEFAPYGRLKPMAQWSTGE